MNMLKVIEHYAALLSSDKNSRTRLILVTPIGYISGKPILRGDIQKHERMIADSVTMKDSEILCGNEEGFLMRDVKVKAESNGDFETLFVRFDMIIGCSIGAIQ